MKRLIAGLALALLVLSSSAQAQSTTRRNSIEQLVDKLEIAYANGALGRLDRQRPYLRRVKIVIEHSLAGDTDKDRFEIREFKTLAQAEKWLTSRQREDGTPFRDVRSLLNCKGGVCRYDFDGGILHNHLYLKRIAYGYSNRRPYIKTIYLLDGD
jgi:hypothetical protein